METFWVKTGNDTRLALVLRPQGGHALAADVEKIKAAGVDVLVSMLPPDEAKILGLAAEGQACEAAGIVFRSYPIPIRRTPQSPECFASFVDQVREDLRAGRSIAVHCQASIGRSSIFLAALMIAEGFAPDSAWKRLSEARGVEVPDTAEQTRWVQQFALRYQQTDR